MEGLPVHPALRVLLLSPPFLGSLGPGGMLVVPSGKD